MTVPFGKYRDHGWLQVFDATMVGAVIETFAPAFVEEQYYAYGLRGWRSAEARELEEAEYYDVHACGHSAPDHAAAARGVACLDLTK
jgi:hypothetical protein